MYASGRYCKPVGPATGYGVVSRLRYYSYSAGIETAWRFGAIVGGVLDIANISDRVGDRNHATTQVSTLAGYCVCI